MAIKKIVQYPEDEAILRIKSKKVRVVNRQVKKLIRDLKDTLLDRSDGIGIAAPQIAVHIRVIMVRLGYKSKINNNDNDNDDDDDDDDGEEEETKLSPPLALVNPIIIESGKEEKDFDGCLSIPGLYADTVRPHYLRVSGLSEDGKPFNRLFEGFDAVVIHHEIDHLEGVLFIDRADNVADMYRLHEDKNGKIVRVPLSDKEFK